MSHVKFFTVNGKVVVWPRDRITIKSVDQPILSGHDSPESLLFSVSDLVLGEVIGKISLTEFQNLLKQLEVYA